MTTTEIELDVIRLVQPSNDTSPTNPLKDDQNEPPTIELSDSLPIETTPELSTEPVYPTGFKFHMVTLSLALAMILDGFDNAVVATAVPSITNHFHTVRDVGWYSAAYRLSLCAFQFMFGKLYSLFSAKQVFLVSILIMQIGSVMCGAATSSIMFVFGRAVAGFGAAGVNAGAFNLMVQILPLRRRPAFVAVLSGIESVAELTAPILGGVLTEKLSWRWCFWITLPPGAVTLVVVAVFLTDPQQRSERGLTWRQLLSRLDLLGNLVFVPSITCLFIALSWAGTKFPWNSGTIIGLFAAFVGLLALFVYDQYLKGDNATLPPRILRQRTILFGFVFSTCCAGTVQVFNYYLPIYFQEIREVSPAKSGYLMVPAVIAFMVGMLTQGFGTTIVGFYTPFMLLGSVLGPIAAGLMTTWRVESPLVKLICYSAFINFATGVGYQGPQVAVQTTLSAADGPMGLAVILFAQHFGAALFVSMAQTIFTNRLVTNLHSVAPMLNATGIEDMSLSELKGHIGSAKVQETLMGFDRSLIQTWYLGVGLMCVTMVGTLGVEWRSVKQKKS